MSEDNYNLKDEKVNHPRTHFSIESNATKPFDIALMTGNKKEKKVNKDKRTGKNHK